MSNDKTSGNGNSNIVEEIAASFGDKVEDVPQRNPGRPVTSSLGVVPIVMNSDLNYFPDGDHSAQDPSKAQTEPQIVWLDEPKRLFDFSGLNSHALTNEDRKKLGVAHLEIFTDDQVLNNAIFQESANSKRVFYCGNEWLIRFGQDKARLWELHGITFLLCDVIDRIPEPPTYADIRQD